MKKRQLFNKAFKPMNKENVPQVKAELETVNPDLQEVFDLVAGIQQADPETMNELMEGLAQARSAGVAAAEAKENAETEAEFDKACEDALRAREKEEFFTRLLNKYRFTPRIDDETYDSAVDTVKAYVDKAVDEYRATAKEAMSVLIKARRDLLQVQKDANKAIVALDGAANVLQCRHRYRIVQRVNCPDQLVEDPNEWLKYAVRYDQGQAVGKAMKDPNSRDISYPYDRIICAAIQAAERAER